MKPHFAALLLLLVGFALLSSPALAESPPSECFIDSECAQGLVCVGETCISESYVCAISSDCSADELCDHTYSTCPWGCPSDDSACAGRCEVENGFCRTIPPQICSADSDCGSDQLCAVALAVKCAEDDQFCEEIPKLRCVDYLRFCGPNEDYFNCSAQESCDANGRCVWTEGGDYVALSNTVVVDDAKAEALRAQWIEEIQDRSRDQGQAERQGRSGCSSTPSNSSGALPFLVTLLGFFWVRRPR